VTMYRSIRVKMGCRTWEKIEVKNFDQNKRRQPNGNDNGELRSAGQNPMHPARISERSIRETAGGNIFSILAGHEEVEFSGGEKIHPKSR